MSYIALNEFDLALAALLVVINGGLSIALQLGLERQLAIATVRMVVQLTRVERRGDGYVINGRKIFISDGSLASLVTVFALTVQVNPDPWYNPRYALPLLGMVLGNTMTGIALGLHTLTTGLVRERAAV